MSERTIAESGVIQLSEAVNVAMDSVAVVEPQGGEGVGTANLQPSIDGELPAERVVAQESDEGAAFRRVVHVERRQRGRSKGRRLASGLLAFSLAISGAAAESVLSASTAHAADADTYPWPNAPCEFGSSGGASCVNPANNHDLYDWFESSNGQFSGGGCGTSSPSGECFDNFGYEYRNCTSYVAQKISQEFPGKDISGWKSAYNWATAAQANGYSLDTKPQVGDIAVWGSEVGDGFGHVAYVASVNQATQVATFDEYNVAGTGAFSNTYTSANHPGGKVAPDEYIHMGNPADNSSGSGTTSSNQGSGVGTAAYKGSDHLVVNQPLYQGQYIESPDGMFVLELQGDGNLVEYGPSFQPVWASNTSGANIGYVVMQPDGNLVGYTPDGRTALWSNGEPNSGNNNTLYMQPDGNLVEYTSSGSAVWSDGKNRPGYYPPAYKGGNELITNEGLYQNQYIRSNNGEHFVLLQTDGSAVVYGPGGHVVGGFGPQTSGAGYVVLQPDGNFVEYQPNGQTSIWGNGEVNSGGSYMTIQDDGNFVEYQSNGTTAVWGTGTNGKI